MKYTEIMVRYGELSTKGKNRKDFINRLGDNVRQALYGIDGLKIIVNRDRMHVRLNGGQDDDKVINILQGVFGIENLSPSVRVEKNVEDMQQMAVKMILDQYVTGKTFKITTKRQDKEFEFKTFEVNNLIGDAVLEAIPGIKVDVKNPDIELRVEIRSNGIYLSSETIKGAGGFPVGTGGRATMMLSGGIDSPVAAYMGMRRGVKLDMIHFYSPPYTSEQALAKAKQLTSVLAQFSGNIRFIQVPFTKIQEEIKEKVPEGYLMTVQRRMMLKIASMITEESGRNGIFNGEALGQVASQTLESMRAINDVTTMPVLRPLLSMDKTEIIKIAEKIGTYDLSILPFEDCCTIFTPPAPKTKPNLEKTRQFEKNIDVESLAREAIDNIQITTIHANEDYMNENEEIFAELL
ncbi:tRNA uracil 4-sulfurtransferase ThiI [Lentilactobacillus laojiaonis]|uniref:tRNA uracil 4-sulfurtransferase ThiI n=1 Tax=Lentilactobacillus laojiaonis TaxID=2883998 RepID=UPI001D0B45C7|nr:tRNA uracil 4-sulfurtransferase ThiI [Lentilactobacillus laojiaonis]UDM31734.1 tRNA 4-thiouridine(8) synthase ThiI [Lentilactobacillus laojiaonis]